MTGFPFESLWRDIKDNEISRLLNFKRRQPNNRQADVPLKSPTPAPETEEQQVDVTVFERTALCVWLTPVCIHAGVHA